MNPVGRQRVIQTTCARGSLHSASARVTGTLALGALRRTLFSARARYEEPPTCARLWRRPSAGIWWCVVLFYTTRVRMWCVSHTRVCVVHIRACVVHIRATCMYLQYHHGYHPGWSIIARDTITQVCVCVSFRPGVCLGWSGVIYVSPPGIFRSIRVRSRGERGCAACRRTSDHILSRTVIFPRNRSFCSQETPIQSRRAP
jgi:hypothetical protein